MAKPSAVNPAPMDSTADAVDALAAHFLSPALVSGVFISQGQDED